jgi:nitronate monooxygenase
VERHDPQAPLGYPAVHHLTRELRQAAAAGRAQDLHLWAGTGYRSAGTGPAADVVRGLAEHR